MANNLSRHYSKKHLIGSVLLTIAVLQNSCVDAVPDDHVVQFSAEVKVILESSENDTDHPILYQPRDLAFEPGANGGELWIVNRGAPYRIENGSYLPNADTQCQWRYGGRSTPPENSKFWPSFTVISNPGLDDKQSAVNIVDPWGIHFLSEASSIAFGTQAFSPRHHGPSELTDWKSHSTFATCGESRNEMKGCVDWKNGQWQTSTPLDFQGPSLWTTDPAVIAQKNLVADEYLAHSFCKGSADPNCPDNYTDPVCKADNPACTSGEKGKPFTLGSHLDMLHESPLCMGIAWERNNAYWVFDGCGGSQAESTQAKLLQINGHGEDFNLLPPTLKIAAAKNLPRKDCQAMGDIVRYDFRVDHGAGFDDHCDGIIERYAIGKVKRKDGVPSHLLVWQDDLFIADTGNRRIARLDPASSGGRAKYNAKPLSERGNDACTVVWDMKNAQNADVIVDYFTHQPHHKAFTSPSGLAVIPLSALPKRERQQGDVLVVSDNESSHLFFISLHQRFNLPGQLLGYVDLSKTIKTGGLMGIAVHPQNHQIYLTDAVGHRIIEVKLKE